MVWFIEVGIGIRWVLRYGGRLLLDFRRNTPPIYLFIIYGTVAVEFESRRMRQPNQDVNQARAD